MESYKNDLWKSSMSTLLSCLESRGLLRVSASAAHAELTGERVRRPSMLLPFCGEIVTGWCHGVRLNHGLHTQCTNAVSDTDYCVSCSKHAEKSGKPPHGDIRDRAKFTTDYRDPSGALTLPYANVAGKLKLDLNKASAAAAEMGWTIPAEQLLVRKTVRGRPKSAAVSDTDSDTSSKKVKVRKHKAMKAKLSQDDLIAKLVLEAASEPSGHFDGKSVSSVSSVSSASSELLKQIRAEAAPKEAAKVAQKAAQKAEKERIAAEAKAAKAAAKAEKERVAAEAKAEKDAVRAEKERVAAEAKAAKAAAKAEKDAIRAEKERVAAEAKAAKVAAREAKLKVIEDAKAAKEAAKEAKLKAIEDAKAAKLAEKAALKAEKERMVEEAKAAKLAEKAAAKAAKLAEREAEREAKKVSALVEKIESVRASCEALSPGQVSFAPLLNAGSDLLKGALDGARKALKKLEREAEKKEVSSPEVPELEEEVVGSVESESEGEEEEEITLSADMKYEHEGVMYFKTSAYGFENMLFSLTGDPVGILDMDAGTLQEVSFDEDSDDEE